MPRLNSFQFRAAASAALLLLAALRATAGSMAPLQWSYQSTFTPQQSAGFTARPPYNSEVVGLPYGSLSPFGTQGQVTGSSATIAVGMTNPLEISGSDHTWIDVPNMTGISLNGIGGYVITLTLKDNASRQSGSLSFSGQLSGSATPVVSPSGFDWQPPYFYWPVTNTFTSPTTESVVLGHNVYTVTVGPFIAPDPNVPPVVHLEDFPLYMGSSGATIDATVSVVANTPEPATLTIADLGLAGAAVVRQRRNRLV